MDPLLFGQKWRGEEWSHWDPPMKRCTLATLGQIIEKFNQGQAPARTPPARSKRDVGNQAMHILDAYRPRLSNDQVRQILMSPIVVLPPSVPVEIPRRPPNLPEIKNLVQNYLQQVYQQSWHIRSGLENNALLIKSAPFGVIESKDDLHELWRPGVTRERSHLRLDFPFDPKYRHPYMFSDTGALFPYRGRGPTWRNNSCAVDCCIVAGRLLGAGMTEEDCGGLPLRNWVSTLSGVEKGFISIVLRRWERFSNDECFRNRGHFFGQLLKTINASGGRPRQEGHFFSATEIWQHCTSKMNQFSFSALRESICSSCQTRVPKEAQNPQTQQNITLDELDEYAKTQLGPKPNMSRLINYYFDGQIKNCRTCNSHNTRLYHRTVYGELPSRLVVFPSATNRGAAIGATSSRFPIRYTGSDGKQHEAQYRWLGGIYLYAKHFRLYWTDDKPADRTGNLIVYDGMELDGAIVGGVLPTNAEEKISMPWAQGADMLFYERIEANNSAALQQVRAEIEAEIKSTIVNLLPKAPPKVINIDDDDDDDDDEGSKPAPPKTSEIKKEPSTVNDGQTNVNPSSKAVANGPAETVTTGPTETSETKKEPSKDPNDGQSKAKPSNGPVMIDPNYASVSEPVAIDPNDASDSGPDFEEIPPPPTTKGQGESKPDDAEEKEPKPSTDPKGDLPKKSPKRDSPSKKISPAPRNDGDRKRRRSDDSKEGKAPTKAPNLRPTRKLPRKLPRRA